MPPPPRDPRPPAPFRPRAPVLAACLALAACDGPQSTLNVAGTGADSIAGLWWWMAAGALLVWLAVVAVAVYAIRVSPEAHGEGKAKALIIGGGAVFPTVVLGVLVVFGLGMMPDLLEPGPGDGLRIRVSGEEWWWRVTYEPAGGEPVEAANEVRVPVGERVEFSLSSPDVIHSFWIPSLGGKIDMIPGRTTRLALEPTRTGTFRGTCAEYCGASHAWMSFDVVVMEPGDFRRWLEAQRAPATPAAGEGEAARGAGLFLSNGCGACHTVRGTAAAGVVGPDLTHVGSRETLGAGILENDPDGFLAWITSTDAIKPGVHMPAYDMLPEEDRRALAAYLDGLR